MIRRYYLSAIGLKVSTVGILRGGEGREGLGCRTKRGAGFGQPQAWKAGRDARCGRDRISIYAGLVIANIPRRARSLRVPPAATPSAIARLPVGAQPLLPSGPPAVVAPKVST